jgi:hypothetical protein
VKLCHLARTNICTAVKMGSVHLHGFHSQSKGCFTQAVPEAFAYILHPHRVRRATPLDQLWLGASSTASHAAPSRRTHLTNSADEHPRRSTVCWEPGAWRFLVSYRSLASCCKHQPRLFTLHSRSTLPTPFDTEVEA